MKHPPYHLRLNKAVDRFLLVEVLNALVESECLNLSGYTYYGLGGPFLEDCRLLREYLPFLSLVSLEEDEETFERQRFHRFARDLTLKNCSLKEFLSEYRSTGSEILWLDYTKLKKGTFSEFRELLEKSAHQTIIKITVPAHRPDNPNQLGYVSSETDREGLLKTFKDTLTHEFHEVLPGPIKDSDIKPGAFPRFVQSMLQVAAEKALPAVGDIIFQPLHSTSYRDSVTMLSVTGIVTECEFAEQIKSKLKDWRFANFDWSAPRKIDMPVLSVKERLQLECLLPEERNAAKVLAEALKYRIDDSDGKYRQKLRDYADFHRYYPYFAKISV